MIAVGALWLLGLSCGRGGVPSVVSRFPADLTDPRLELEGIYSDGWVTDSGSISLTKPRGDAALTIWGTVPKIESDSFRTDLSVLVDDREVERRTFGVGDFRISIPVNATAGVHRVTLTFTKVQELPKGDGRTVGALLRLMGFESAASVAASGDIVKGLGVELGSGWGALETFKAQTFRWIDNDAQLIVRSAKGGAQHVSLIVEPGPGVGPAFVLNVLDASGKQIDAVRVARRETVNLFLPIEAEKPNEFRLHVDGGGKRMAGDPRILNFRVFSVRLEP